VPSVGAERKNKALGVKPAARTATGKLVLGRLETIQPLNVPDSKLPLTKAGWGTTRTSALWLAAWPSVFVTTTE